MSPSLQPGQADNYRSQLISAIAELEGMRESVFGMALNLAMSSELREINDVFDIGDDFTFELKHLEDMADPNVQIFVRLIRSVEDSVNSIMNINNITNSEIGQTDNP